MSDGRDVLIVGAGSLGSLYGAALAQAGRRVTLLGRRQHTYAIREQGGLRVVTEGGERLAPVTATSDPSEVGDVGTVVLLTQCQDTEAALAGLEHVRSGVSLAVSLQNGGDKNDLLAAWAGAEAVIGGTSMVGATLDAPGVVRRSSAGMTYLGERDGAQSERVEELARDLRRGGLETLVTDRVRAAEWSKLLNATATMTIAALARIPVHAVFTGERTSGCYAAQIREGVAVARAAGTEVGDWPGMAPVESLCRGSLEEAGELVRERGRAMAAAGEIEVTASMLRSILTDRPLEVEHVHGYVVREAERCGIEVPMVTLGYALLQTINHRLLGGA